MTGLRPLQRRGQPLRALVGLLLCWIAVRIVVVSLSTDMPAALPEKVRVPDLPGTMPSFPPLALQDAMQLPDRAVLRAPAALPSRHNPPMPLAQSASLLDAPRIMAGHNLLWMAAMGGVPVFPALEGEASRASTSPHADAPATLPVGTLLPGVSSPRSRGKLTRWGGDGWVLWRAGQAGLPAAGAGVPTYGGSQAGVVLRYALASQADTRPALYLRAVHALGQPREGDLAAGMLLRPLPGVPVTAHGELRVSRRGERLDVRPSAFVSAGMDQVPLAVGVTATGYVQAGYVGGRFATAIAGGSVIAEKPLWRAGDKALSLGGGAWGGAQRGSARLDIGPSAALRFGLGEGSARLAADYRLRVAGNAAPSQGAAITLSAGF